LGALAQTDAGGGLSDCPKISRLEHVLEGRFKHDMGDIARLAEWNKM